LTIAQSKTKNLFNSILDWVGYLSLVDELKDDLFSFISFACLKETNQRKRQPQIFFGLKIFRSLLALRRLSFISGLGQTDCFEVCMRAGKAEMGRTSTCSISPIRPV